jgi:hypothetical protein
MVDDVASKLTSDNSRAYRHEFKLAGLVKGIANSKQHTANSMKEARFYAS